MANSWEINRLENSPHFERAFHGLSPELKRKVVERIALLRTNPRDSRLDTHKLKGRLAGDWSFSVDQRNRVRFKIMKGGVALLIDVGSHDIYKR